MTFPRASVMEWKVDYGRGLVAADGVGGATNKPILARQNTPNVCERMEWGVAGTKERGGERGAMVRVSYGSTGVLRGGGGISKG